MPLNNKSARLHLAVGASALALMLTACGGGGEDNGADDGDNGGSDAATVTVGSGELNPSYMCIKDPDVPGSMIISATGTSVDDFDAQFGYPDREDRIGVTIDDVYWEASGSMGEVTSLDLDADNSSASGEATFENSDGDTESGTFNISCS